MQTLLDQLLSFICLAHQSTFFPKKELKILIHLSSFILFFSPAYIYIRHTRITSILPSFKPFTYRLLLAPLCLCILIFFRSLRNTGSLKTLFFLVPPSGSHILLKYMCINRLILCTAFRNSVLFVLKFICKLSSYWHTKRGNKFVPKATQNCHGWDVQSYLIRNYCNRVGWIASWEKEWRRKSSPSSSAKTAKKKISKFFPKRRNQPTTI